MQPDPDYVSHLAETVAARVMYPTNIPSREYDCYCILPDDLKYEATSNHYLFRARAAERLVLCVRRRGHEISPVIG